MTRFLEKRLVVIMHRFEVLGGQERSTYEVLTRLARRGWRLDVYSFTRTEWPRDLPIHWHRIPGIGIPTVFLRALWFRIYVWLILRRQFQARAPRPIFFTLGVDSFFADVRSVQFLHSAAKALIEAGRLPHPNDRTLFHKAYQKLMLNVHVWLERHYLARCRALIAISQGVERDIGIFISHDPRPRIHVIHHAADATSVVRPHRSKSETSLIFVGTLERKGIEKALYCLSQLKHLTWHFSVLGDGNLERWRKLAKELGMENRVEFLGHRAATSFYSGADILLLPSLYEPFGLVISEAVSLGCLPLASVECGAMELWGDRPQWMRISAFDENSVWVDALRRLMEDRELREAAFIEASKAFHRHSWEAAALGYETVFEEISGTRREKLEAL